MIYVCERRGDFPHHPCCLLIVLCVPQMKTQMKNGKFPLVQEFLAKKACEQFQTDRQFSNTRARYFEQHELYKKHLENRMLLKLLDDKIKEVPREQQKDVEASLESDKICTSDNLVVFVEEGNTGHFLVAGASQGDPERNVQCTVEEADDGAVTVTVAKNAEGETLLHKLELHGKISARSNGANGADQETTVVLDDRPEGFKFGDADSEDNHTRWDHHACQHTLTRRSARRNTAELREMTWSDLEEELEAHLAEHIAHENRGQPAEDVFCFPQSKV
jgi:hypothetical protein